METILKNEKGFALALITALLPALIGAVLVTFAVVSFVQMDLKMHHICRSENIRGQETVAPLLRALLAMNPMAVKLRAELIRAEVLAKSKQPFAVAKLIAVKLKVAKFVIQQQQLIKQSNLLLLKASTSAKTKLWREKNDLFKAIPLFTGSLQVLPDKVPVLAVRPDSADMPPTYSPVTNFASAQALEQRWQYRLSIIKPLQAFLTGSYNFQKSCAVTLKEEDLKWVSQIRRDKFL